MNAKRDISIIFPSSCFNFHVFLLYSVNFRVLFSCLYCDLLFLLITHLDFYYICFISIVVIMIYRTCCLPVCTFVMSCCAVLCCYTWLVSFSHQGCSVDLPSRPSNQHCIQGGRRVRRGRKV